MMIANESMNGVSVLNKSVKKKKKKLRKEGRWVNFGHKG